MNGSLLSHIASNFIPQYENVSNSCISYLLNNYDSAQLALKKITGIPELPVRYVTELATVKNGRPDITGLDMNGEKSIIIEGKFWAHLTSNQPNNYLSEIKETGMLMFLVPLRRLESIKHEIFKRVSEETYGEKILICSWADFLHAIEIENSKAPDFNLTSDLKQLSELCERMDEEGMPPLSESDLDPTNGRITYLLTDLLEDCNARIRDWPESDFKGTRSAGDKNGYYFYFKAYGFGCCLNFSNFFWFKRKSHTPFYLIINKEGFVPCENIQHALHTYAPDNVYEDSSLAISLKAGMDRSEAVNHLVESIKNVLVYLSGHELLRQ